jgi:hypothetical protein
MWHPHGLGPMKYKEAMAGKDKQQWETAVKEEFDRMEGHKVFELVRPEDVPAGAKILTSTWAMKKKSNGTYRARINCRGYEQVDGEHYDKDSVASPTVNIVTVRIMLVLMLMMRGYAHLMDVNGAFLLGSWENDPITDEERKVYMYVPEGFKPYFPTGEWILLLLKTIYGTKQAAKRFWLFLLGIFKTLAFKYNRADPCLYYHWGENGLVMWASWVDDCLGIGIKSEVLRTKNLIAGKLKCDDLGAMMEYVGCKIDIDWSVPSCKFTQPVLIQSFRDEFQAEAKGHTTPAIPGSTLQQTTEETTLEVDETTKYRSGTGKLLHVMRWSRPDVLNATREVSQFMGRANQAHLQAMQRVLEYCVGTPERGLVLAPTGQWDGKDKNYPFIIRGRCDSEHAKCKETRRSVGGHAVYLNDAPVVIVCRKQRIVTLSVGEAELVQATEAAQDMLYVYRELTDMGLTVETPMIEEIDNSGAIDISNNWSSTGRTRHMDIRYKFLRELKEANLIRCVWIPTDSNETDIFTKSCQGPLFAKHIKKYVGEDAY